MSHLMLEEGTSQHWLAFETSHQSMCVEEYDAKWERDRHRCPNLVPSGISSQRITTPTYRVTANLEQSGYTLTDTYDSLADMWTDFYRQ